MTNDSLNKAAKNILFVLILVIAPLAIIGSAYYGVQHLLSAEWIEALIQFFFVVYTSWALFDTIRNRRK